MYNSAPINKLLHCSVKIQKESSIVTIDVNPDLYHAANAVHGSLYFKSLDDSAFFAVNSIETEVFVLTTQFNIYLTRPISTGFIRAEGKLVSQTKSQFIAESIAYDSEGREIGRGSGLFVKSKIRLDSIPAYSKKLF
jgi:uncharacterized protein (TIGR00369 family)